MCLLVPGKIIEIKDGIAKVDYGKEKRTGKILEKGFSVGDYVMIQGGIVLQKVEREEARRALEMYKRAVS